MRAMPFLVATPSCIDFHEPQLQIGDVVHVAGDPVPTWDYMASIDILGSAQIDQEELLSSTGLTDVEHISAVLQVDCPQTGFRRITQVPLAGSRSQVQITVQIGPHLVAEGLEVRMGLVLNRAVKPHGLSAHRKGSRIYSAPSVHRFLLEGTGGGFPTEAFDFEKAGYPAGAAWRLNIKAESLDLPFNAAVRLLINTGHPQAGRLLSGKPGVIQSVLFHDVFEHMLLAVSESAIADEAAGHEEGSLGAVLDELTQLYLGLSLSTTLKALLSDRSRLLAKLQEATGFLEGDSL